MNILHSSDFYGGIRKINKLKASKATILVLSGDICLKSDKNYYVENGVEKLDKIKEKESQDTWVKEEFIPWCESLTIKDIVIIPGNHDLVDFTSYRKPNGEPYFRSIENGIGCLNVQGLKFCLMTGILTEQGQLNDEVTEEEFQRRLDSYQLAKDADVLVTHCPPQGIIEHKTPDGGGLVTLAGSKTIRDAILGDPQENKQPFFTKLSLHAFGHAGGNCEVVTKKVGYRSILFSNATECYNLIEI